MSVRKFKFVSPGVFVKEIDNSQLPAVDTPAGPIIFGRLPQGPGMRPVKIDSFSDFVQTFGNPIPGKATGDVWRDGNHQGTTYASYAAQAYLRADVGSITVMRLLGEANADAVNPDGYAGWQTVQSPATAVSDNGGAYGIFICQSGSGATKSGHLGAIFYMDSGSALILTGTVAHTGTAIVSGGAAGLFEAASDTPEWTAAISNSTGEIYKSSFNFDRNSSRFIRNVFNTNPQTVNSAVVPSGGFSNGETEYWLGESFESYIAEKMGDGTLGTSSYAVVLAVKEKDDQRQDSQLAHTGWFFSQDLSSNTGSYEASKMKDLFRLHARDAGSWLQNNLKVSIQDLKYSRNAAGINPFGSFTVLLRKADDTDNVVEVIERYSNCNLNPNSDNYIARKIGDRVVNWNTTTKVLQELGTYANISKYIRVEVHPDVENGQIDPRLLPFGVYGPEKLIDIAAQPTAMSPTSVLYNGDDIALSMCTSPAPNLFSGTLPTYGLTCSFPDTQVRISASAGALTNPQDAYFGLNVSSYLEITGEGSNRPDEGYGDYLYSIPPNFRDSTNLTYQWIVSLDDLILTGSNVVYWQSGSRSDGDSITAGGTYQTLVDTGYTRFTSPFYDGFDGLDIIEIEPFRNTLLSEGSTLTNYAQNTIRRAIDTVADSEFIECNMMSMPGLTDATLTEHMIQVCEDRGDALAIIDIPGAYTPFSEGTAYYSNAANRVGTVSSTVSTLESRQINSSYGCTYYPWVQIKDTINGNLVWVPPSIIALGTFASSEAVSELWFAPAGFNRGGLTEGSAGIPVLNVTYRLTSKDRDDLYEASINPIASFPNEGLVIFGQKTLQSVPSALDRINVRRMLIYVKKQISLMASSILFDPNVQVTWNRFKSQAEPFLSSVQTRLGISEYKLVLDKSTTTPDLVDQNIVYAKIFLKPTRAIEFIAIDFIITNTGAGFED